MEIMALLSMIAATVLIFKRPVWEKVLGVSSMGVKLVVLSSLLAFKMSSPILMDVSLFYSMISGAGVVLFLLFLMRGEMD